jgi:hypothetical protein
MSSLKDSILDLIFLGVILSTLFYPSNSSFIIIWVYTGLLIVSKLLALFMPALQKRASKTTTPNWVYHLIYAASFGTLLYIQRWYLAAAWGAIWILSIILLSIQTKKSDS